MPLFSFHLAKSSIATSVNALLFPPKAVKVPGLLHAECLAAMTLGSPIISPARMQLGNLAMFASWQNDQAIDDFLAHTKLGRSFATGWHVRLEFLRRWGMISEFNDLPENRETDPASPVVAVTLARLKLSQTLRFIRWGKPVEELVRDHPGKTLALAAIRPPNTFSTFSIWHTQQEMTDMVHGYSRVSDQQRHAAAMLERNRKDFHYEFTTLRFRALSEHGEWAGRSDYVPHK